MMASNMSYAHSCENGVEILQPRNGPGYMLVALDALGETFGFKYL